MLTVIIKYICQFINYHIKNRESSLTSSHCDTLYKGDFISMSLTDKETHHKDEVLFAGSMRHRKLPRARRRKKRTPEISAQPVGTIDPLTGEITVPDKIADRSETDIPVPEDVKHSAADNVTAPKSMMDPMEEDFAAPKSMMDPMEDMIIPDDMRDYESSDGLLWTDLDEPTDFDGSDEDPDPHDLTDSSKFPEGADIEANDGYDIGETNEIETDENIAEDMFPDDIEEEDVDPEGEDNPDDGEQDEESSGRFSLSNMFKRTRPANKKKKKSQSRRKKASSGIDASGEDGENVIGDDNYDDDLADDEAEEEKTESGECLTLCNPMDYTVHGILQARILEWVAVPFFRGSFQPRD